MSSYSPIRNDDFPSLMATAEHLLHEAQYAFLSISYGESRENKRNAARARSLSKKIIRKFPASKESEEAHAILRRLGDEAYTSKLKSVHTHVSQAVHHQPKSTASRSQFSPTGNEEVETLKWAQLVAWLFGLPKAVVFTIAIAALFFFLLFGPFLIFPLLIFVLFTGPFRRMLKPERRERLNESVVRINEFLARERDSKNRPPGQA